MRLVISSSRFFNKLAYGVVVVTFAFGANSPSSNLGTPTNNKLNVQRKQKRVNYED